MENQGAGKHLFNRRDAIRIIGIGAASTFYTCATAHGEFARVLSDQKKIIRTILKDLPPNQVGKSGAIMCHEHLSLTVAGLHKLGIRLQDPNHLYYMSKMDIMVEEVKAAMKDGVSCMVEASTPDIGRNIGRLRKIAKRTGIQIVASGGYHTQPSYPPKLATETVDQIADQLVHDSKRQRWGAFGEIGSAPIMTPEERKVFYAVGKAHVRTNLPIFTHTAGGKPGLEQLDIFESVGVKPQNVSIGHMGGPTDPTLALAVCKRGAYVGFDQIAFCYKRPDWLAKQAKMIRTLVDAGYVDHILLGTDLIFKSELKRNGGPGYGGVLTVFVPVLRQFGITDAMLHHFLVENPRRWLSFVPISN